MNLIRLSICILISLSFFVSNQVFSKEFISSNEATELIELYTSEGCSSCPPADKWLSELKADPQLFNKFFPLSFHVDYWNQLGWEDRFSKPQYTNRQYQHLKEGSISQVYTPGFVVSNEEWRSWRFSSFFQWPDNLQKVGVLKADYNQDLQHLNVSFRPEQKNSEQKLSIHVAILGMSLSSEVRNGENSGRQLKHDFVVLSHAQQQVSLTNNPTQQWQLTLPDIPASGQKQNALVVWLAKAGSQQVIQVTGGYL